MAPEQFYKDWPLEWIETRLNLHTHQLAAQILPHSVSMYEMTFQGFSPGLAVLIHNRSQLRLNGPPPGFSFSLSVSLLLILFFHLLSSSFSNDVVSDSHLPPSLLPCPLLHLVACWCCYALLCVLRSQPWFIHRCTVAGLLQIQEQMTKGRWQDMWEKRNQRNVEDKKHFTF